jgi:hypothetical protein
VPLSEYFMQDPSALDMLRSIAKKFDPQKLSHLLSTNRGGLAVAGSQGVWLSQDYLNTLYVCRGSLQGEEEAKSLNLTFEDFLFQFFYFFLFFFFFF